MHHSVQSLCLYSHYQLCTRYNKGNFIIIFDSFLVSNRIYKGGQFDITYIPSKLGEQSYSTVDSFQEFNLGVRMGKVTLFLLGCLLVKEGYAAISTNPEETKYFSYSTPTTRNELILGDVNSLNSAPVRTAAKTFLIIDGFLSDSTSPMSQTLKDELLRTNPNTNVIVVDWGKLSGSGSTFGNQLETYSAYLKVLNNVGPVAQRTADFLEFLKNEKGISFSHVHIIGHSLGAHIAGATGLWVTNKYGGLIDRATGLDPAGPLFSGQNNVDKRLHKGDAAFVDIYHTNRGTLGDSAHQTGDVNVYVNGGASQPGCEEADSSGFAGTK
ncbi:unnamed protein product [Orchesella dallaii]|uniref:Lipase domain-containing protein n=1 Tax=Orchesella dallaii TaxID=48710 RepID=A0ABP1R0F0_9HEXA